MKRFTRIICTLLLICMIISSSACANPGNTGETTTEDLSAPLQTAAPAGSDETTHDDRYDADGYLKSTLPEDLNFNDVEVTVLWWTDVERPEFFVEDTSDNIISEAIFNRNAQVESKLGITLAWDSTKGQYNNGVGQAYAKYVGNSYDAGDAAWDIITAHSRTIALTSQYGYCADLMELQYLDFEMPWWPKVMTETAKIGDALYYVTGDCSTNALHMMYTIFYNKDLVEKYQLEEPTKYVYDNTWTVEQMTLITKDLYGDLDNGGSKNENDFYGLTTLSWHFDSIFYGSGLRVIEEDEDNLFKLSPELFSNKANDLCDMLGKWCQTNDVYVNSNNYRKPFERGDALLCLTRHKDLVDNLTDADFKFGIVPVPKYDTNQENYITCVGNPVSFYSIYGLSEDLNRAAAVLECWASEAYRTTTPAIFEQTFKLRYSDTSAESDMYDLMRSGIVFDIGRFYAAQLNSPTDTFDDTAVAGSSWQTKGIVLKKLMERSLDKIIDAYQKIQG